jgi:hypothetical protein
MYENIIVKPFVKLIYINKKREKKKEIWLRAGCGGACLSSQPLGRQRQGIASCRPAWAARPGLKSKIHNKRAGCVVQVVECLLSICKPLNSMPSTKQNNNNNVSKRLLEECFRYLR